MERVGWRGRGSCEKRGLEVAEEEDVRKPGNEEAGDFTASASVPDMRRLAPGIPPALQTFP